MGKVWTESLIISVATEMYQDGTGRCERYPQRTWQSRGWPEVDDDSIIVAIDAYLRLLKSLDEYYGREQPEYRTEFSVGIRRASEDFKKTKA